ncbi:MAG: hypothetical protein SCK70_08560 [bacterium]|nr:hypothetical protein [bacterium]
MKKLGLVLLAMLVTVSFGFAQADIGLKAVGGKVGFVMPEGTIDNTKGKKRCVLDCFLGLFL